MRVSPLFLLKRYGEILLRTDAEFVSEQPVKIASIFETFLRGLDCGEPRLPLLPIAESDMGRVELLNKKILGYTTD